MSTHRGVVGAIRAGRGVGRLMPVFAIALLAGVLLMSGCDVVGAPRADDPNGSGGSVSATPQVPPARQLPLAGKVVPGPVATLGVYVPPAPFDSRALDAFETKTGGKVAIVMWYQPWAEGNRNEADLGACAALLQRGVVPLITWEPWNPGNNANRVPDPGRNPEFRLSRIIAGEFDDYIAGWARSIRRLGGPVMLRPMHEMNGNWYPWGGTANGNKPAEFKAAWRHIHDIFEREGATNVTWVWSINHESVPATKANRYAAYYPGDAYVDWTSISGFNWGTSSPVSSWHTWAFWYSAPLAYLETVGKPVCVSEVATVERGGNKAAWITDAYRRMAGRKIIGAVIYYNAKESGGASTQDWRVDTSPASLRAFRKATAKPGYARGPVAALSTWTNALTEGDWGVLRSFQRLY